MFVSSVIAHIDTSGCASTVATATTLAATPAATATTARTTAASYSSSYWYKIRAAARTTIRGGAGGSVYYEGRKVLPDTVMS